MRRLLILPSSSLPLSRLINGHTPFLILAARTHKVLTFGTRKIVEKPHCDPGCPSSLSDVCKALPKYGGTMHLLRFGTAYTQCTAEGNTKFNSFQDYSGLTNTAHCSGVRVPIPVALGCEAPFLTLAVNYCAVVVVEPCLEDVLYDVESAVSVNIRWPSYC